MSTQMSQHSEQPRPTNRDAEPSLGPIPEPRKARRPARIAVEDFDNKIDGSAIEGASGDYLFTVGNTSSGKSTLQSYLIHRLYSDKRMVFGYATTDGNPANEAYLNGWVQNIANGHFPKRTNTGDVRQFTVEFGQRQLPMLELSFIEIAGEEIASIVPTGSDADAEGVGLNELLDRYLREPNIRKRFLFVSDASANRAGALREAPMYSEDILFNTLLRYLLKENGVGLKRVEALFVAAKWDEVKHDYASERQYFETNFPRTLATVAGSRRIRASFIPFSVGEVVIDTPDESGESKARILRKETKYIDVLISWIYQSFTQRRLIGHEKVRRTLWDRIKDFFGRIGG